MKLIGPSKKPISGKEPKNICIMLHGVGADGQNLIGLADMFAKDFPDTYFVAPNGPEAFSGGGMGYQWFPYYDRTREQIIKGVENAAETVTEFAYQLLDKYNLQPENLILMGFSQGAMVSIQAAVTMQDNCAGVIAFSGGLLKIEIISFETRSQPPICLIHGEDDQVVPYQMSEISAKILSDLNVPAEFHKIENLDHSIDMNCISIARKFLKDNLK